MILISLLALIASFGSDFGEYTTTGNHSSIPLEHSWEKTYPEVDAHHVVIHDLKWVSNGNILILAGEGTGDNDQQKGILLLINPKNGQLLHEPVYKEGAGHVVFKSIAYSNLGDIFVVGYTQAGKKEDNRDALISKYNAELKEVWGKSMTSPFDGRDELTEIVWDTDQNIGIALGKKAALRNGDLWKMKIPASGTTIDWSGEDLKFAYTGEISGTVCNNKGVKYAFGKKTSADGHNKIDLWVYNIDKDLPQELTSADNKRIFAGALSPNGTLNFGGFSRGATEFSQPLLGVIDPGQKKPAPFVYPSDNTDQVICALESDATNHFYAIVRKPWGYFLGDYSKPKTTETVHEAPLSTNRKLEINHLVKTYKGYYVYGGTLDTLGKKVFKLCCFQFKSAKGKSSIDLQCAIKKQNFTDTNKDGLLSPGEQGFAVMTLTNNSNEKYNGGQYYITKNSDKYLNITTPATGEIPEIGPHDTWEAIIGYRFSESNAEQKYQISFNIEGSNSGGCDINIEAGVAFMASVAEINIRQLEKSPDKTIVARNNKAEIDATIISKKKLTTDNVTTDIRPRRAKGSKNTKGITDDRPSISGGYAYNYREEFEDLPEGTSEVRFIVAGDTIGPFYIINNGDHPQMHIVAISPKYSGQDSLKFNIKDTRDMVKTLYRQTQSGIFGKCFVDTLIGPNATREKIMATIDNLRTRAHPDYEGEDKINDGDYLIVYYSGHGDEINGRFYLSSTGCIWGKEYTQVDYKVVVNDYLDKIPCKRVLLMDACYSGIGSRNSGKLSGLLAKINSTPPNLNSFSSCSDLEKSYELYTHNGGNGVFTKALLEAFNGAEVEVLERNGRILDTVGDFNNLEQGDYKKKKIRVKITDDIVTGKKMIKINDLEQFLKMRVPAIAVIDKETNLNYAPPVQHPKMNIKESNMEFFFFSN